MQYTKLNSSNHHQLITTITTNITCRNSGDGDVSGLGAVVVVEMVQLIAAIVAELRKGGNFRGRVGEFKR